MAASVPEVKQKRQREECSEDDENLHKRSRDDVLPELFISTVDDGDVDAANNDLVLQMFKSLQAEISGVSVKGKHNRTKSDVGQTGSFYEDLLNATDDQLGIEENDDDGISNKFWNDLFENPSNSTAGSLDVLHSFLSHCYSFNSREYMEYHSFHISEDQQEWIDGIFADLASQSFLMNHL